MTADKDGEMTCANMCPPECDADSMICPGGMDANGCKMMDTCMPSMLPDKFGSLSCPTQCPIHCADDQMSCSLGEDERGCPLGNTCMPTSYPGLDDVECPMHCP